ncbi:hypothetical protein C0993_009421, partial [Termitomyces sp. T159_Od127]
PVRPLPPGPLDPPGFPPNPRAYAASLTRTSINSCTTSKHTARRMCPTRSMNAEWIGRAYMSGSQSFAQRYAVRRFATSCVGGGHATQHTHTHTRNTRTHRTKEKHDGKDDERDGETEPAEGAEDAEEEDVDGERDEREGEHHEARAWFCRGLALAGRGRVGRGERERERVGVEGRREAGDEDRADAPREVWKRALGRSGDSTERARTADDDGEQDKALVAARERVEDDAGAAAEDHGAKERGPALGEEGADVRVAQGHDERGGGEAGDEDAECEGDRGVDDADERGGDGAHPEEGDEVAEAGGDGRGDVVWGRGWEAVRRRRETHLGRGRRSGRGR